jgi:hypothetical protein
MIASDQVPSLRNVRIVPKEVMLLFSLAAIVFEPFFQVVGLILL